MRLVARDGHSHWAEPEYRVRITNMIDGSPGGTVEYGYAVPCDFGGVPLTHWIMRDARGHADWQTTPYWFATEDDAEAARDELAAQQPGEGE